MTEMTVFKNLIRRWDIDQSTVIQVTAYEIFAEEVEAAAKSLKSKLHDKFKTNEVLDHFPGQSLLTSSHYSQARSRAW